MMLKDNPSRWQELYASNDTRSFSGYGFGNVEKIALSVQDPPSILRDLRSCVEDFWGEFIAGKTGFTNEPKYRTQGFDYDYDGKTLTVNVFMTDYATVRFKNSRGAAYDEKLTHSQQQFLNELLKVGVGAYLREGNKILLGRCRNGIKQDLLENVPQGMGDPDNDYTSISSAFARELSEETGLSLTALENCRPTHINVGRTFGDFTIIYQGEVLPTWKKLVRSQEHTELWWMKEDTLRWMVQEPPLIFNPVTVALVEALEI